MTSTSGNISEPITLEAVKFRFHQWRTTRLKRNKIPESLWNDVRQLSKLYNYSQRNWNKKVTIYMVLIRMSGKEGCLNSLWSRQGGHDVLLPIF